MILDLVVSIRLKFLAQAVGDAAPKGILRRNSRSRSRSRSRSPSVETVD